eukprot:477312_1
MLSKLARSSIAKRSVRSFSTKQKSNIKKTTQLRQMLQSSELEYIMEAHNGMSAIIAEEAGFKAIWGSGLCISAAMGVRDSNEASWTQVLDVLEYMSDATSIPILLDGDTGYGNFNNARRLITKLEQRDIAGVCLEDKVFPKTNSFIAVDGGQPLADEMEFALKLQACKETQTCPDFNVVARVEAFIAGWTVDEALKRAELYANHGADAILMHSKLDNISEIESFMKVWDGRKPVVIVPTKYYKTPTSKFRDLGCSTVIWANHSMRTSIQAMQGVVKEIYESQSLQKVEEGNMVVSVAEIFRLTNQSELKQAESKYLPENADTKSY